MSTDTTTMADGQANTDTDTLSLFGDDMPAGAEGDGADEVASELVDVAELVNGQSLVVLSRTEAGLAKLRADLATKTYDLTTAAGNRDARVDRRRCVKLRAGVEKVRADLLSPVLEFTRKVNAEAKRITAEIAAIENPLDAAIKADAERRERERKAREEAEAQRLAGLRALVDKIMAGFVVGIDTWPVDKIHADLCDLAASECSPELADVEPYFAFEKAGALVAMSAALRSAQEKAAAEALAALEERDRREREREREELQKTRSELAAMQARLDAAEAKQAAPDPLPGPPAAEPCAGVGSTPMPEEKPRPAPRRSGRSAAAVEPRLFSLLDLNNMISPLGISSGGLHELGFKAVDSQPGAVPQHYLVSDLPAIQAALVACINKE